MTLPLCVSNLFSKIGYLHSCGWKNPLLSSFCLHNFLTIEIQDNFALEIIIGKLPYSFQVGIEFSGKCVKYYNINDGDNK